MDRKIKAVVDLMQTLGVSIDDVVKAVLAEKSNELNLCNMDTKIKAVFNSMQTLGINIDDMVDAVLDEMRDKNTSRPVLTEKIEYGTTRTGLTYATYKGKVLGLVFCGGSTGRFVLAMHHNSYNRCYAVAKHEAEALPPVAGKKWIVPSDAHFMSIKNEGVSRVKEALREIGSDEIRREAYLSSTSQGNQPRYWAVRFVLPLD